MHDTQNKWRVRSNQASTAGRASGSTCTSVTMMRACGTPPYMAVPGHIHPLPHQLGLLFVADFCYRHLLSTCFPLSSPVGDVGLSRYPVYTYTSIHLHRDLPATHSEHTLVHTRIDRGSPATHVHRSLTATSKLLCGVWFSCASWTNRRRDAVARNSLCGTVLLVSVLSFRYAYGL